MADDVVAERAAADYRLRVAGAYLAAVKREYGSVSSRLAQVAAAAAYADRCLAALRIEFAPVGGVLPREMRSWVERTARFFDPWLDRTPGPVLYPAQLLGRRSGWTAGSGSALDRPGTGRHTPHLG